MPASGQSATWKQPINGSEMLTQLRAPGSLDTRWLLEDAPLRVGQLGLHR